MFTIQIANNAKAAFKTIEEVKKGWEDVVAGIELGEGQKIRVKDSKGEIVFREVGTEEIEESYAKEQPPLNEAIEDTSVLDLLNETAVDAWDKAIDVVTYPIAIVPAYRATTEDEDGDTAPAEGITNTGREKEYYFIMTDRMRSGEWNVVNCVTQRYLPVAPAPAYEQLRECLEEMGENARPTQVYVSFDGGRQRLTIELLGQQAVDIDDEIVMRLFVDTSSDGTKSHQVSMIAHNKTRDTDMHLYGGGYSLAAKHTQGAIDRIEGFAPALTALVNAWNDEIIPMLKFMNDSEFDRGVVLEFIESIAKDTGLGMRHTKRLSEGYERGLVETGKDTMLGAVSAISKYIEEESTSPEARERFQEKMAKSINRAINKLRREGQSNVVGLVA